MTFGSLFSGIGGMDLGLERAGWRCAWQVEIDDYARRVLRKHWPSVPMFADVRDCGRANLWPVTLIAGGFPCQDISEANVGGVGLRGARSGLWWEFHRIISELRPSFALVENVANLLNRGIGDVLGSLADIGYDAEWSIISACAFGASHARERLFVVAYPQRSERRSFGAGWGDLDNPHVGVLTERQKGSGGAAQRDQEVVRAIGAREPGVRGVADGVPYRMDRLRGIGNAVAPFVAEYVGRRIRSAIEGNQ